MATLRATTEDNAYTLLIDNRGSWFHLSIARPNGPGVRREDEAAVLTSPAVRALVETLPQAEADFLRGRIAAKDAEQAAADRMAALLSDAEAHGTPVFVRWGKAPESGRSHNHREGVAERGVSVYRAWRISETRYIVDWRRVDAVAGYTVAHDGRDVYVLTGDVVGYGGDGEPLLASAKQVRMHADAEIEVLV